jgi:hypothetical protein
MAKPEKEGKKPYFFAISANKQKTEDAQVTEKPKLPDPQPSLKTIGLTDCSVCRTECSVVLTRSGHPFTACGKCGARTFYNSRIAIDILKRHTRELKDE